ncbi:MAG: ABC transporter substrate-binding protein [Alphaproteobacteria bacterium]|nr:ABC transporter substrate-binding protein [Alphaproteobacteria bacterium]
MRRREFAALFGAAVVWPSAAMAQSGLPRVAVLALGNPDPQTFMKEFREGLRELGYVEGQNIQVELRSAGGDAKKLPPLAAELVTTKTDIIVGLQTPAATAAKQATRDIPIVLAGVGDPIDTGLIHSLARPGGNITGVSSATAETGAKNLELIREVFPSARKVAVLANAPDPFSKPLLEHIQAAAKILNLDIKPVMVNGVDHLEAHFDDIMKWQADAIVVQPTLPLRLVAELAIKSRLPAFAPSATFTTAGGLMSYGNNIEATFRQSAVFVDKILKGRKPADLPVDLPTKYWLAINLKTAKAIGVTVPGLMLTRADDVID